ncbi:type II toxin-antitoxin system Phd/YefM family antitoxin [uncultured Jannaschia sp.]|uniref:type II toxin-antitoxin system Phd/YefM family antitoxin n=1 Tax=uncultured Jannaschia sp. TaxID=293347 RepID=UPI002607C610|nr:type II toxin-antitoxin system Phd/YefM family antitoxin [uncultured Jannaschia sp.]
MWSLQDAKARFSAVVDAALAGTPQEVTRRGRPAVVIVAAEQWRATEAASRAAGLRAHLAALPDRPGADDPFPRAPIEPRDVDL